MGSRMRSDTGKSRWPNRVRTRSDFRRFLSKIAGQCRFRLNGVTLEQDIAKGAEKYHFQNVWLPKGKGKMEAFVLAGYKKFGARYVELARS